MANKLV